MTTTTMPDHINDPDAYDDELLEQRAEIQQSQLWRYHRWISSLAHEAIPIAAKHKAILILNTMWKVQRRMIKIITQRLSFGVKLCCIDVLRTLFYHLAQKDIAAQNEAIKVFINYGIYNRSLFNIASLLEKRHNNQTHVFANGDKYFGHLTDSQVEILGEMLLRIDIEIPGMFLFFPRSINVIWRLGLYHNTISQNHAYLVGALAKPLPRTDMSLSLSHPTDMSLSLPTDMSLSLQVTINEHIDPPQDAENCMPTDAIFQNDDAISRNSGVISQNSDVISQNDDEDQIEDRSIFEPLEPVDVAALRESRRTIRVRAMEAVLANYSRPGEKTIHRMVLRPSRIAASE